MTGNEVEANYTWQSTKTDKGKKLMNLIKNDTARPFVTLGLVTTLFLTALFFALSPSVAEPAPQGQTATEASLYERLGVYGAISAVVNDFAEKLFTDPKTAPFFKGMGTDTRQSFIQKNINLVCNVTGGPCKIISRNAKTIHAGLGITEAEFNIVENHLVDTLDAFNVPAREKRELLAIIQREAGAARDHRHAQVGHR